MNTLLQDIRYAARMLLKSPGFTAITILTLALGIGANTALFSVVNGVLLNPLPYPHPNRLVIVDEKDASFSDSAISYPNFLDWVKDNHTFEALAAYRENTFNLTGSGEAENAKAVQVSANFFSVLGVKPVIGRNFSSADDVKGAAPVVMLSAGLWKSKFGGSPQILGKTVALDGTGYTIIGVVPANFYFCCETTNFRLGDVYTPLGAWNSPWLQERTDHIGIYAVGRLKPGVTLEQARADMDGVARTLAALYPDADKDAGISLTPLKESMVRDSRPMLLVLLAAVGFVLLIACVNVANLVLARATGRSREFAIRAALGATQGRVIRQLLTESVLLAIAGGGLGLLLASWGTEAALNVLPEALPRANNVHLDPRVLLFTLAISIGAGLLFGLAPALKTSRPDLQETLKEGGRGASGARYRTQGIFVVIEMALAVVLLIGAGLTIRSLVGLWNVNPGFDSHNVLSFTVDLPPLLAKQTPSEIRANLHHLVDGIGAIPGVQAASFTDGSQPMNGDDDWPFWIAGRPKPVTEAEMPLTLAYIVTPDYFKVMRIPLLRGRFLSAQDDAHSTWAGVIDENFAQQYFPNQSPIGKHIVMGIGDLPIEIVGVVGHVKQWGLDSDATGPIKAQLYTLVEQLRDEWVSSAAKLQGVVVRTETPSYASAVAIQKAVEKMNSDQIAFDFESMDQAISDSLATRRFAMILLGVFAAMALALASIGIYGVISYIAGQRTHEIGIRLALGAQPSDVLKLMLREGASMALVGVGIGLVAAVGLTRLMKTVVFGVSATDPVTFAAVAVVLTMVALAACYIPARRAMRVDPMVALRYE